MRAIFGLVLVVGMGLAGFAVYMVQGHLSAQQDLISQTQAKAAAIVPTVDVYAVNRPVAYGEQLTLEDVIVIKHTRDFLPEGSFATEEDLFPDGPDVPRVVTLPMDINEPILASKVTLPGEDAGITSRLAPGMRAFTIKVDVASGVSGFLRPGNRVDVYWTGSISGAFEGGAGREITRLIESSVEIIAVDQSADANRIAGDIPSTVTVQVSPQDVADLAQAQSTGALSLSLVGTGDETIASAIEVDQQSLLGIEIAPVVAEPVQVAEPVVCTIRQRRGAEVVEIPIPCQD